MANEISFTDWKKGDILTAERLNNIQDVVQMAGKALGIISDDNNTSNSIQFSGASASVGSVNMNEYGLTVGNNKGAYTTTLYGTLKTNIINGINSDDSVTINNLIVGTADTVNNATVYTGIARFNIDEVEFKKDIKLDGKIEVSGNESSIFPAAEITNLTVGSLVSNNGILTLQSLKVDQSSISSSNPVLFSVGHSTIDTQTSSISQYNGEAVFNTAKTTLHGQTVIDSEVSTDLTDLLTVGHTSGSGANVQYYGKAVFNTSQTEFYDIISYGHISAVDENGVISSINASFGQQDNSNSYHGETVFRTNENTFYGTTIFEGPTTINNLTAPVATTTSDGLMSAADKLIMNQVVTGITLNDSEIPKRVGGLVPLDNYILPSFDRLSDGIYTLQMTLTNGNPSYEWISNSQGE